jgi:hypothetical protein
MTSPRVVDSDISTYTTMANYVAPRPKPRIQRAMQDLERQGDTSKRNTEENDKLLEITSRVMWSLITIPQVMGS